MSGTSLRYDGALRGPVEPCEELLAIAGWLYPAGGAVRPPTVEDAYWRSGSERHNLGSVIAGQSDEVREQLVNAHAAAIEGTVRAATAQKVAGECPRALVAAASRLLHELIGQA